MFRGRRFDDRVGPGGVVSAAVAVPLAGPAPVPVAEEEVPQVAEYPPDSRNSLNSPTSPNSPIPPTPATPLTPLTPPVGATEEPAPSVEEVVPAAAATDVAPVCDDIVVNGSQPASGDDTPPPGPLGGVSLSGRVTAGSGRPLAGAVVTVLACDGTPAAVATSGRDGTYRVAGLVGSCYAVAAQLEPHRPTARLLSLSAGQVTLDLVLPGRGSIAGRVVTGRDAIALPDIAVRLSGPDGTAVATTFSTTDGSYRFDFVDEGRWTLLVQSPRYRELSTVVEVRPGECADTELRLVGSGGLRGRVTSPGPIPVAASIVMLLDTVGEVSASAVTDALGAYEFPEVPSGRYTLVAIDIEPAVGSVTVLSGEITAADLSVRQGSDGRPGGRADGPGTRAATVAQAPPAAPAYPPAQVPPLVPASPPAPVSPPAQVPPPAVGDAGYVGTFRPLSEAS